MKTTQNSHQANKVLKRLHTILREIDDLGVEGRSRLAAMLKDVYWNQVIDGDVEPPLGLDWTLNDSAVAKALYEEITGDSVD